MTKYYLGIEIGGTKLQMVVGNDAGIIIDAVRFDINKNNGAIGIQNQITEGLFSLRSKHQIEAVGVGFGGPVDTKTGKIFISYQIEGWSGFNLAEWIKALIDVPVYIENDANVAALGEATHGAGKEYTKVFYITLGSGVGGGYVYDGNIYHGASIGEVEIGHVRLDKNNTTLESQCSGWAVDHKIKHVVKQNPTGVLSQLVADRTSGEAKFLAKAIELGDEEAMKILTDVCEDLSLGLSHVVHLLNPQIVILGGGLSLTGEILRRTAEETLPKYVMKPFQPGPRIALTQLGENAVPIGALELAKRKSKV